MKRAAFLAAALFVALAWPGAAHAQLRLCNQTSYVLYAAMGAQTGYNVDTRGWMRVAPGACEAIVTKPLKASSYFLSAHSSHAHAGPARVWGGSSELCTKETDFALKTPVAYRNCTADDAFFTPFATVNTKGRSAWTTTLTESAAIASLDAARDAGIVRLLKDIGYPAAARGAKESLSREAALKRFKARMRLPQNASPADLFDALETEAMKASAPQGYAICNDSGKAVWAALALPDGKKWVTRGWWQVAPGSCAKALTDPLKYDTAYLRVERGPRPIVEGKAMFCVTDIEFEVQSRDKCPDHGLRAAGFAETAIKGRTGYAAHIADNGLLPPAPAAK